MGIANTANESGCAMIKLQRRRRLGGMQKYKVWRELSDMLYMLCDTHCAWLVYDYNFFFAVEFFCGLKVPENFSLSLVLSQTVWFSFDENTSFFWFYSKRILDKHNLSKNNSLSFFVWAPRIRYNMYVFIL